MYERYGRTSMDFYDWIFVGKHWFLLSWDSHIWKWILFLSKDGKYEGLSEVKISYLERTEEGDEERDGEIYAEAVEDGDDDEVLSGCTGDDR